MRLRLGLVAGATISMDGVGEVALVLDRERSVGEGSPRAGEFLALVVGEFLLGDGAGVVAVAETTGFRALEQHHPRALVGRRVHQGHLGDRYVGEVLRHISISFRCSALLE